jgi:predicted PolB exonuclease-like 3'-5' exonuclease
VPEPVSHLVFDVEAVGDGALIARVKYPDAGFAPAEAVERFKADLLKTKGSDVLPAPFVRPCAVAVAKVAPDGTLLDLKSLDDPRFDPSAMVRQFWEGWRYYQRPTLVTFNGRGYDLPVMELGAYRDGLSLPDWFKDHGPSYQQPRNRYNNEAHLDLMEVLSNHGASRLSGGLNLLANLLGKPGKSGMDGSQVQEYHDAGGDDEINRYCRCDVLDTYFVFLRTRVLTGRLTLDEEHARVSAAKALLEERAADDPACRYYLDHWGDWTPPETD